MALSGQLLPELQGTVEHSVHGARTRLHDSAQVSAELLHLGVAIPVLHSSRRNIDDRAHLLERLLIVSLDDHLLERVQSLALGVNRKLWRELPLRWHWLQAPNEGFRSNLLVLRLDTIQEVAKSCSSIGLNLVVEQTLFKVFLASERRNDVSQMLVLPSTQIEKTVVLRWTHSNGRRMRERANSGGGSVYGITSCNGTGGRNCARGSKRRRFAFNHLGFGGTCIFVAQVDQLALGGRMRSKNRGVRLLEFTLHKSRMSTKHKRKVHNASTTQMPSLTTCSSVMLLQVAQWSNSHSTPTLYILTVRQRLHETPLLVGVLRPVAVDDRGSEDDFEAAAKEAGGVGFERALLAAGSTTTQSLS
jgi:hypothetical protein